MYPRTHDANPQNVRLKLHERIVARGAPVDPQLLQLDARIAFHRLKQVRALIGDALERRPCDMAGRRTAREAEDGAARVGVPMRAAESGERRHQVHAAVVSSLLRDGTGRPPVCISMKQPVP